MKDDISKKSAMGSATQNDAGGEDAASHVGHALAQSRRPLHLRRGYQRLGACLIMVMAASREIDAGANPSGDHRCTEQ